MGGRKSMLGAKSPMVKARSSSIYSGRGSAAFMEGPKKDGRAIKDKTWQAEKSQELIEFLITANYNHHISPKIIQSPTRKDFECIFQYLYHMMDPNFEFSAKFEDDVILIFKKLRYPFEVKKSALFAVGSPQYWPSLLAALSWLVELIKYDLESRNSEPVDFSAAEDLEGQDGERLTYQYLQTAYRDFLSGKDEQSVEEFFGPFYVEKERCLVDEVGKLQEEATHLEARLAVLQDSDTPLLQATKRKEEFAADVDKFAAYISQLEERLTYFTDLHTEHENELASKAAELNTLEEDKKGLLEQISTQPISATEVQEMSMKRDAVGEQLRQVQSQMAQVNEQIIQGERSGAHTVEEISAAAFQFSTRAAELRLIRTNPQFELTVNPDGNTPTEIMHVDLQHSVLPALDAAKAECKKKVHAVREEQLTVKAQANQADDEVMEKKSHLQHMAEGICKIEAEVSQAQHSADTELEELLNEKKSIEEGIGCTKQEHAEHVARLQQTVDAVKAEYEEKKAAFAAEQQQLTEQLMQAIELVTAHKAYIHTSLLEVEMTTTQVQAALQKVAC